MSCCGSSSEPSYPLPLSLASATMSKRGKNGTPEGMKACYKAAKQTGDRDEEARWANQIGHAYKNKADYVSALTWFRLDYDISSKRQVSDGEPSLNMMPTCQSLGEVYLRLANYPEALHYQHRHHDLALEAKDPVEEQRASTQLGRTYMDLYEATEDGKGLRKAKEFLNKARDLALKLKGNPPKGAPSTFVVELIDAYNNLGMLRMITDEPKEARKFLEEGLRVCDAEEIGQHDAARTRLHHNLGRLFSEKRQWKQAIKHVMQDIEICQALPHPQGEVKGLVNLADIHFKERRYKDALDCYRIATTVVQKLQDEDNLINLVQTNKEIVQQAVPKLASFNVGMEKHKELQRKVEAARGSAIERKLYQQECKLVKELIGQAYELQYWEMHLFLSKRLKKVVSYLGDLEKHGDAVELIGESYFNLCEFQKAKKWHNKSFEICKRLKHIEGQSVALINYGNAVDAAGDHSGALEAYEKAYEIVRSHGKRHLLSQQVSALENIHYCYVVRFDKVEEASKIHDKLENRKQLKDQEGNEDIDSRCSETDNEAEDDSDPQHSDWDDEELPIERPPLLETTNSAQKISTQPRQSVSAKKSQPQGVQKRSRLVLSDNESVEPAEVISPNPSKRKLSQPSSKTDNEVSVHPSSTRAVKSKRSATTNSETFNLSSDDDEPLEYLWKASLSKSSARGRKKCLRVTPFQNVLDTCHENVSPPSSSKGRNRASSMPQAPANDDILDTEDVSLQHKLRRVSLPDSRGRWTSKRILNMGGPSHRTYEATEDESLPEASHAQANGDSPHRISSQEGLVPSSNIQKGPGTRNAGNLTGSLRAGTTTLRTNSSQEGLKLQAMHSEVPDNAEERMRTYSRIHAAKRLVSGVKAHEETPLSKAGPMEGTWPWERVEHVRAVGDTPGDVGKASSHHDAAGSFNSGSPMRSIYTQAPLIVQVNINGQTLRVITKRSKTIGWLMEEILRLYSSDSSTAGKKPVLQRLEFKGTTLKPVQIVEEVLNDLTLEDRVDAFIQGWVSIPLAERYEAHCAAGNAIVNPALVYKLNHLKGICEEVDASNCDLRDDSARPLIAALQESDALSALDLSHNLLSNGTMHAIQEMIAATNQSDLGLTLDLHHNQLGASALMHFCKCPVTLSRLEVLKLSGNRLTDAAARHLAIILAQNKALATLEIEGCGLTTRAFQQISSSLHPDSSLVKLCVGRNNPILGNTMALLLQRLSTLISLLQMISSFTELDIRGIELDEKGVTAVTSLLQSSSSLCVLNMAGCGIQNHGAQIMWKGMTGYSLPLLSLDLSLCGFSQDAAVKLCAQLISIQGLGSLNLNNNHLNQEAAEVLAQGLAHERCRLKSLSVNNCHIGETGVLQIFRSLEGLSLRRSGTSLLLKGNTLLWELHVAGNFEHSSQKIPMVMSSPLKSPHIGHDDFDRNCASALNREEVTPTPCIGSRDKDGQEVEASGRKDQSISGTVTHFGVQKSEMYEDVKPTLNLLREGHKQVCRSCHTGEIFGYNEQFMFDTKIDLHNHSEFRLDLFSAPKHHKQVGSTSGLAIDENEARHGKVPSQVQNGYAVGQSIKRDARAEEVLNPDMRHSHLCASIKEELVMRIQMAQWLHCLDLKDNGLSAEVLVQVGEAWSHRGKSPKKGYLDTAHFIVQDGRECSTLTTACSSSHLHHSATKNPLV